MVQALHELPDGLAALLSWPPVAHRRVQADVQVNQPAAVYHGGVLLATGDGASTVAVYDGQDAATGDLIDYFGVAASGHEKAFLERGVVLRRGLFVDVGSNVSSFVFFYRPPPRDLH